MKISKKRHKIGLSSFVLTKTTCDNLIWFGYRAANADRSETNLTGKN